MPTEVELVFSGRDDTGGTFGGILGNLGNLGNVVTGIKSAFDLVSGAIDGAVNLFMPFIDSASESEQAVARLDGILRATGGAAGLSSQQLQDMANSLQNVTRFSDETILGGEALLLTFRNISGEMLERAVPAMADMAEIFGSVDASAMQLGKALNDPLAGMGALSRAGITFSDVQKDMIKNFMETGDIASAQNVILTEVENQVKGLAETMGGTFAGQVAIANNQLDTIRETIGGPLLSSLNDLTQGFIDFINTPEVQSFVNDFAKGLSDLFAGITSGNITAVDLTEMFRSWIVSVDWNSLSQDISNGLNSIDWSAVSQGLGNLSDAFTTILIEIDWSAIAGAIWESLIQGFMVVIDNGANTLIRLLADAFTGGDISILQQEFKKVWSNLSFGWDDIGAAIVDGLVAGVQWAWGNFKALFTFGFDDIIKAVKDFLGIHSRSTIFYDISTNIVQGLIDGWNNLFAKFKSLIDSGVNEILQLFAPILRLFGFDVPNFGGTGTVGGSAGGNVGGTTGGGLTPVSGTVVNNYYGPVYFGSAGAPGAYYDCPSPHPLVAASGNQLVRTGF